MTFTDDVTADAAFEPEPEQPPAPLVEARKGFAIGPVAVDFGTSSATVTMYERVETWRQAIWPGQAAVIARRLAELLRRADWPVPQEADRLADAVRERVGATLSGVPDGGADALAGVLEEDAALHRELAADRYPKDDPSAREVRSSRLDEVIRQFELRLGNPRLTDWLAVRLDEVFREGLSVGVPEAYALTAVRLDLDAVPATGLTSWTGRDIASRLVLGPGEPIARARLGASMGDSAIEFGGIKRYLAWPDDEMARLGEHTLPPRWEGTSDLLLALAYRDLVDRSHAYLDYLVEDRKLSKFAGHRIEQLTITYPTVTPPAHRKRLRSVLSTALDRPASDIDMSYDEAVAASLYFVMRELGGDSRSGVDALRARYRRAAGVWKRTMLVIDIGGGTTDIALLSLELRAVRPEPHRFGGGEYVLSPRVLGTSGHAQLGGDLLTLRVFYWIKAIIADALAESGVKGMPRLADVWPKELTGGTVPERLAPLVVGFDDYEAPAPVAVREALRALVPTHSTTTYAGEVRSTPGFRRIWDEAERAKLKLAEGKEYRLSAEWLITLQHSLTCGWAGAIGGLGERVTPLRVAEFTELVRPVVQHAMRLAASLARRRLSDSGDPVLDLVALAGRTCSMRSVQESAASVIGDILLDDDSGRRLVRWNPTALLVEEHNAKQAASIGAAWAHSRAQLRAAQSGQVTEDGNDLVDLAVEDLLLEVPCTFQVDGMDLDGAAVFEPGDPFDETDPRDGTLYRRSRWLSVQPTISLSRRVDGGRDINWGTFRYTEFGEPLPDVEYCIELDQQLLPTVLLRRGRGEHRDLFAVIPPWDLSAPLQSAMGPDGLSYVPRIEAGVQGSSDVEQVTVLFDGSRGADTWLRVNHDPIGWAGRPGPTGPDGPQQPVRAAVATRALPRPKASDRSPEPLRYRLRMLLGPHDAVDLGVLVLPHWEITGALEYWVALDAWGRLWVGDGKPTYPLAGTLADMEADYGSVFVAPMMPPNDAWDLVRDPYSGLH